MGNKTPRSRGQQIFNEIQNPWGGRTDAGVHARGQCFHFDADWAHDSGKLIRALHSILPTTIQIRSARPVPQSFHARHSAIGKRHRYRFYLGRADPLLQRYLWACRDVPLNLPAMKEAAHHLIGCHDFSAYGATHGKDSDPNPPIKQFIAWTFTKKVATLPSQLRAVASLPNGTEFLPEHSTP